MPWLKPSKSEANLDLPFRDYGNQSLLSLSLRLSEIHCTLTTRWQYGENTMSFIFPFLIFSKEALRIFPKSLKKINRVHYTSFKTVLHFSYILKRNASQHWSRQGGRERSMCIVNPALPHVTFLSFIPLQKWNGMVCFPHSLGCEN